MITSGARFAFFALTALLLAGCAGKVRYPDYYMLALAPSKGPAANEGYKLPAVAVQRFETPAYLRQGRIVYRQTPEQIGFYEYHRWASDPGQVVTTAMIDSLRAAGVFSTVQTYDGEAHAPYVLQGRLEHLDEVDYENGVRVEVRLYAQLLDTKTGTAVWAGDTTKKHNCRAAPGEICRTGHGTGYAGRRRPTGIGDDKAARCHKPNCTDFSSVRRE